MKKIFLVVLISLAVVSSMGQQSAVYLKKNNTKNTVGWILATGGTAMVIGGVVAAGSNASYFPNETVGTALIAVGGASLVTGLLLIRSSNREQRNADAATVAVRLKMEQSKIPQHYTVKNYHYPALAVNIKLK